MDTSDLSHHIHSRYNAELEGIRTGVLQMGGLVEQQLQNGVKAIVGGDSRLGEEVARQDHKVNAMEVAIDEDCSRILATRAPTASDLRLIVAVIKTITDLERIGDETEKLGHAAARLSKSDRTADRYRELKHIGELVADMVHGALDAFARLDTEAALSVARRDRVIDEEYEVIQRQCITFMMEDPRAIRRTLDMPEPRARARARGRPRQEHLRIRGLHGAGQGHPPPVDRGRRAPDRGGPRVQAGRRGLNVPFPGRGVRV